jgi:hypothetical protein
MINRQFSTLMVGVVAIATPAWASVAVSNSGSTTASASASLGAGTPDSMVTTTGFVGAPAALSAFAYALSSDPSTGDYIESQTVVGAAWFGADAGGVQITLLRDFVTDNGTGQQNNSNGQPNWSYDFTAAADSVFKIHYDFVASGGNPFGFQGWVLNVNGATVLNLINVNDPTGSGDFSFALTNGQNYVVDLVNSSNICCGNLTSFSGRLDGNFDWRIGDVPEPASWAMMIAGFGMVGGTLRRRRIAIA